MCSTIGDSVYMTLWWPAGSSLGSRCSYILSDRKLFEGKWWMTCVDVRKITSSSSVTFKSRVGFIDPQTFPENVSSLWHLKRFLKNLCWSKEFILSTLCGHAHFMTSSLPPLRRWVSHSVLWWQKETNVTVCWPHSNTGSENRSRTIQPSLRDFLKSMTTSAVLLKSITKQRWLLPLLSWRTQCVGEDTKIQLLTPFTFPAGPQETHNNCLDRSERSRIGDKRPTTTYFNQLATAIKENNELLWSSGLWSSDSFQERRRSGWLDWNTTWDEPEPLTPTPAWRAHAVSSGCLYY